MPVTRIRRINYYDNQTWVTVPPRSSAASCGATGVLRIAGSEPVGGLLIWQQEQWEDPDRGSQYIQYNSAAAAKREIAGGAGAARGVSQREI